MLTSRRRAILALSASSGAAFCLFPSITGLVADGIPAPHRPVAAFVDDFESGDLARWSVRESARPDSIQVVTDPVRRGRFAAKFTVRPGDFISNGNRAELSWDNRDAPGSVAWYGWSFLIPEDFADTEWRPRLWQCIGQWHDQPMLEKGETWANFPGHSPSIAVYYTSKQGVPTIELWYGTYEKREMQHIVAVAPIQKGRWLDLVFHIGWSPNADGFIEAWLNGEPFIAPREDNHRAMGANMWNAYPHYLKVGLYRNKEIATTNSVYFDEIRIGNSYAGVAPALGTASAPR